MRNIIYYFSGTGNSFQVARGLSSLLENAELRSISGAKEADLSADTIGLVFPVYLWGMPQNVVDFIEKMRNIPFSGYLYAVATYYKDPGDVIGQVKHVLKKQDKSLSAGFTIPMPGNNIIFYEAESKENQNAKIRASKETILSIATDILARNETFPAVSITDRLLKTGFLHGIILKMFKNSDKNFRWEDVCTGCGTCSEVCPIGNIKLKDNRPVWQHNCIQCLSCINLCPQKAIEYGKTTKGKERYINPETVVSDLLQKTP